MNLKNKFLLLINILIFYDLILSLIIFNYLNIWQSFYCSLIVILLVGRLSFNNFWNYKISKQNKIIFYIIIIDFLGLLYYIYRAFQYYDVTSFCPILGLSFIIIDTLFYFLKSLNRVVHHNLFLLVYFFIAYIGIFSFNKIIIQTNLKYKHYAIFFTIFFIFLIFKHDVLNINKEYHIYGRKRLNEYRNINNNVLFLEDFIYGCVVFILLLPYIENMHWLNPMNPNRNGYYIIFQIIIIFSLSIILSAIIYGFSEFLVTVVHNSNIYFNDPSRIFISILHEHFYCKCIYFILVSLLIIVPLILGYKFSPSHVMSYQINNYRWNVDLYYTNHHYLLKNVKFSKFDMNKLKCPNRYRSDIKSINNYLNGNKKKRNNLNETTYIFNRSKVLKFKLDNYTSHGVYYIKPKNIKTFKYLRKVKLSLRSN